MSDVQSALLTLSLLAIISLHPCYLPCPCHRHHTSRFWIIGVLSSVVGVLGLIGNTLSLIVLCKRFVIIITITIIVLITIIIIIVIITIRITLTKYKRSPPSNIY